MSTSGEGLSAIFPFLLILIGKQPSIQKIVGNVAQDSLSFLTEEALHTDAYPDDISRVEHALEELTPEFSPTLVDHDLTEEALSKLDRRAELKTSRYDEDVSITTQIPDLYIS
jgi:proteasome activator subunit 4